MLPDFVFYQRELKLPYCSKMELTHDFFDVSTTQKLLDDLLEVSFFDPHLEVCNRRIASHHKIFAFGDHDVTFASSRQILLARPWTAGMIKIKHHSEKFLGQKFNFALLRYFEDGKAKLSPHHLNASCMDPKSEIMIFSLGAPRTLHFSKEGESSEMQLKAGSLLKFPLNANSEYKQAVYEDPTIQEPTIIAYFFKITRHQPAYNKLQLDWLDHLLRNQHRMEDIEYVISPLFSVILKELNSTYFIDLRGFNYNNIGRVITNSGIMMSPEEFFIFAEKFESFGQSKSANTMAGNILLMPMEDRLHLQKIIVNSENNVFLHPNPLKLWYAEIIDLFEKLHYIKLSVLESMWENFIPNAYTRFLDPDNLILSDDESTMKAFIILLEDHLIPIVKDKFFCRECNSNQSTQLMAHECEQTPFRLQFEKAGIFTLTLINIDKFLEDCARTRLFSQHFMQNIKIYHLSDVLFKDSAM